jgi:hypothetical protein
MEMIRDALSPERLEQMRKFLEHEDKPEADRAANLADSLRQKREDEEERRDRERFEKLRRKMAGVR